MKRPDRLGLARRSEPSRWGLPVVLDLCAVLIFVVVGRLSHDESAEPAGLWHTAWPFLVGVAGGYVGLLLTRWPMRSMAGGVLVAGKTVVLGLVLRYALQDGVPLSFAIVTTAVLGALMLGWRFALGRAGVRV